MGFAAGGPADVIARVVADRVAERLGQPVVVENRLGAGGNIAAEHVARAAPDGHTLMLAASALVQNAAMFTRLPYDPLRDFTPVSQLTSYPLIVVVTPSLPATPGGAGGAGPAAAGRHHLRLGGRRHAAAPDRRAVRPAGERRDDACPLRRRGARAHRAARRPGAGDLPQPGAGPPSLRAGLIRALAVTGETRMAAFPEVPTVAEAGFPDLIASVWHGLVGPGGMPLPRSPAGWARWRRR